MEKEKNKQHVQLPNSMTELKIITPQDLLIYLSIKRYMNSKTKEAFPSLLTISRMAGASINTIRKCVNNLQQAGYLEVVKRGRQNIYKFLKYDNFEPFSYDFLDKQDLSFTEKAYLIASQQYMFKDDGEGKISMSNKELSKKINMSESTISRCDKALEEKEYLQIINSSNRDLETGLKIREKYYRLNSLQQAIVFVLKNHEDRISENTEEINNLKKEIESLKNQMEIWKQKS